tara:strand:+ start:2708 stop:3244 length:537 start_codon:yes stop_codon:yes gene_type:complete
MNEINVEIIRKTVMPIVEKGVQEVIAEGAPAGMTEEQIREALTSREIILHTLWSGFELIASVLGYEPEQHERKQTLTLIAAVEEWQNRTAEKGGVEALQTIYASMSAMKECLGTAAEKHNAVLERCIQSGEIETSDDPAVQSLIDRIKAEKGDGMITELLKKKEGTQTDGDDQKGDDQ